MKREIIPPSQNDRLLALIGVSAVALGISARILLPDVVSLLVGWFGLAGACFGLAYGFQDRPKESGDAGDYAKIIADITAIGGQLSNLSKFLERERTRVADTEATVKKLNDEKAQLEPVVLTQRQTVEAILSAHAARAAKTVWKERAFGFVLGAVSSLAASFIYDYVRHYR